MLKHYCDPNDYNRTFYYHNDLEMDNQLKTFSKIQITSVLMWLRTKEDGGFHSGMLQNLSDSDATFREKARKGYYGYATNLEEIGRL